MTTRTWFLAYPALLLAVACGDDSSDSTAIESGLASDKRIATLTDQEAYQLCDATLDAVSDLYPRELQVEAGCTTAASALAIAFGPQGPRIDLNACEMYRDACITEANKSPAEETRTCDAKPDPTSPCTATVADYERCVTAGIRALAMWTEENLTCEVLAAQTPSFSGSAPTPPAKMQIPGCEEFEAKCSNDLEL